MQIRKYVYLILFLLFHILVACISMYTLLYENVHGLTGDHSNDVNAVKETRRRLSFTEANVMSMNLN